MQGGLGLSAVQCTVLSYLFVHAVDSYICVHRSTFLKKNWSNLSQKFAKRASSSHNFYEVPIHTEAV